MNFETFTSWVAGDLTKEEAKAVKIILTKVLWRLWVALFSFWALGWFSIVGIPGFARASDVDKKVQPTAQAIIDLKRVVQDLSIAQTEGTLRGLRVTMLDLQIKKCKARTEELHKLYLAQLQEAEEQYNKLYGNYFPLPACSDT